MMIGVFILLLLTAGCVNSSSKSSQSQEPIIGTWEMETKDTYFWVSIGSDNQVRTVLYSKEYPVHEETRSNLKKVGTNRYRTYKGDQEAIYDIIYLPERDVWYAESPDYLYHRTTAKEPVPPTYAK